MALGCKPLQTKLKSKDSIWQASALLQFSLLFLAPNSPFLTKQQWACLALFFFSDDRQCFDYFLRVFWTTAAMSYSNVCCCTRHSRSFSLLSVDGKNFAATLPTVLFSQCNAAAVQCFYFPKGMSCTWHSDLSKGFERFEWVYQHRQIIYQNDP